MRNKRKRWYSGVAVFLTAALLAGCSGDSQSFIDAMADAVMGDSMKANQTISDDSKWINSSIDGAIDDTLEITEKDDFYTAVNKDWILDTELDDETTRVSAFDNNQDVITDQLDEMLQQCMQTDQLSGENNIDMPKEQYRHTQELVGRFASSLSDREGRNTQGVEPARAYIEAIADIETLDQMTEYIKNKEGMNYAGLSLVPISMEIPATVHDSYMVTLDQTPSLSLSSASSYSEIGISDTQLKEELNKDIKAILVELGYTQQEAARIVRKALLFEAKLAEGYDSSVAEIAKASDLKKVDHFYTIEELEELQGNYPITDFMDALGLSEATEINTTSPKYIKNVGRIYKEKNLEMIKAYMIVNTLEKMLPYLDYASFDYFEELLRLKSDYPIEKIKDEEYVQSFILSAMSEAVQEVYIGRYCNSKQKQELSDLINKSIEYYRKMLMEEEWLTEETRNKAIEKLDNLIYRVLYPNSMTDYSSLIFEEDNTLIDMIARLNQFKNNQLQTKLNKEIDRYDWNLSEMSTLTINAYYMPTDNSINILAGILTGDFIYDENAQEEVNLARIGMIIGHEITHGFDTSGYAFDKDGLPDKWWTYEDEEHFQIRASHLAKYFSGLSPFRDGGSYDGNQVKGEAIADMGGMKCMLGIAKEMEDFDYDLFFKSYAQLWRSKYTKGIALTLMADEHPLDFFRVNVVLQQFDEFLETYDIKPGDGMYLAPEKRILVW